MCSWARRRRRWWCIYHVKPLPPRPWTLWKICRGRHACWGRACHNGCRFGIGRTEELTSTNSLTHVSGWYARYSRSELPVCTRLSVRTPSVCVCCLFVCRCVGASVSVSVCQSVYLSQTDRRLKTRTPTQTGTDETAMQAGDRQTHIQSATEAQAGQETTERQSFTV